MFIFDDIGVDGFVFVNYGGFDWLQGDWFNFGGVQDLYIVYLGDYCIVFGFMDVDSVMMICFVMLIYFDGVWFVGFDGVMVMFNLFYQGVLVVILVMLDLSGMLMFLVFGYVGLVDQIVVVSLVQGFYVMDDFMFMVVVLELQMVVLMLVGLCFVSGIVWVCNCC